MNLRCGSFLPIDTNQHLNARGGRGFADMSLLKEAHISGNLFSQRSPGQGFGCWNLQWSKRERAISGPQWAGKGGSDAAQGYNLVRKKQKDGEEKNNVILYLLRFLKLWGEYSMTRLLGKRAERIQIYEKDISVCHIHTTHTCTHSCSSYIQGCRFICRSRERWWYVGSIFLIIFIQQNIEVTI